MSVKAKAKVNSERSIGVEMARRDVEEVQKVAFEYFTKKIKIKRENESVSGANQSLPSARKT